MTKNTTRPRAKPAPKPAEPKLGVAVENGILPAQAIRAMISAGRIILSEPLAEGQLQPASLDLRLGAVAYLLKPFNLIEVLALVQQGVMASAAELALRLPMMTRAVSPG